MRRQEKDRTSIRLWSYNVFLRPPPIKNNSDDFKNQRFNILLTQISHYDIVCFQEFYQAGSFRIEELIQFAIQKGFEYWVVGEAPKFWRMAVVDSGLVVLSRYPILVSQFFRFGVGVFSDSAADKGFLYSKIKIGNQTLHLFNVHLQASYTNPQTKSSVGEKCRKEQLKMLKKQMRALLTIHYQQKDLILLIGDFNINSLNQVHNFSFSKIKTEMLQQIGQYQRFKEFMEAKCDGEFVVEKECVVRDLVLENYGHHPITYGEEDLMILTDKRDFGIPQRLDYIFQIQQKNCKPNLTPIIESCMVQKSKVQGQLFTQLSDHYGLTLSIAHRRH